MRRVTASQRSSSTRKDFNFIIFGIYHSVTLSPERITKCRNFIIITGFLQKKKSFFFAKEQAYPCRLSYAKCQFRYGIPICFLHTKSSLNFSSQSKWTRIFAHFGSKKIQTISHPKISKKFFVIYLQNVTLFRHFYDYSFFCINFRHDHFMRVKCLKHSRALSLAL